MSIAPLKLGVGLVEELTGHTRSDDLPHPARRERFLRGPSLELQWMGVHRAQDHEPMYQTGFYGVCREPAADIVQVPGYQAAPIDKGKDFSTNLPVCAEQRRLLWSLVTVEQLEGSEVFRSWFVYDYVERSLGECVFVDVQAELWWEIHKT